MTLMIFAVVLLGILFGYAFIPPEFLGRMDQISTLLLGLLIFLLGLILVATRVPLKTLSPRARCWVD